MYAVVLFSGWFSTNGKRKKTAEHEILLSYIITTVILMEEYISIYTVLGIWYAEGFFHLLHFHFFSWQTFKPLVGKSVYNSITAVEFLVDKQLDFITEDSAFQPYQVRDLTSVWILSIYFFKSHDFTVV